LASGSLPSNARKSGLRIRQREEAISAAFAIGGPKAYRNNVADRSYFADEALADQLARWIAIFGWSWSEWQDLNLRPPRPERGALPATEDLGEDAKRFIDRHVADSTTPGPSPVQSPVIDRIKPDFEKRPAAPSVRCRATQLPSGKDHERARTTLAGSIAVVAPL
jgi:hypothetical protein